MKEIAESDGSPQSGGSTPARMSVALISNYRPDGQQSMLRYGEMLREALAERGYEALLLHPPTVLGRLPWPGGMGKWVGYIDKYLFAPLWLRWKVRRADVVHVCDHSNSMYLPWVSRKPNAITCHDLIAVFGARGRYPGVHTRGTGRVLQKWIARDLVRARYVVCDSRGTEADLRELAGQTQAKFRTIYLALNRRYATRMGHPVESRP